MDQMPVKASVNDHVHKPERQAFHIDAEGIKGNLVSPELLATEIHVEDARAHAGSVTFANDSATFLNRPAKAEITRENENWRNTYDQELSSLLSDEFNASEVVIFDHTIRVDEPNAVRPPARNVHSDYSEDGAKQRLVDILGAVKAANWAEGHYAFLNIWRPLENPINSAPLGFIRPSSLDEKDWLLLDLIYPDRIGQILGVVGNPNHKWIYQSKMTPDEVVVFNIYDNQGLPSVAHSALDMTEDKNIKTIRKSIESRTLVRLS